MIEMPSEENPLAPEEVLEAEMEYMDFAKAKTAITTLYQQFDEEIKATERRRNLRRLDIDIDAERKAGRLLADETMIVQRVIDNNIKRGMAGYMSYTRQSRRLVIFTPTDGMPIDAGVEKLEEAFTRGMRYTGWDIAHEKTCDAASLHGWGWGEVVFDPSKPLHVGIEYHQHERVIFPLTSELVQSNEMIMIEHQYSELKLRSCITDYGWNPDAVSKLIDDKLGADATQRKRQLLQVFKVFIKHKGIVYVGWANKDAEAWFKEPEPLDLNMRTPVEVVTQEPSIDPMTGQPTLVPVTKMELQPVEIETFPVFMMYYEESEFPLIRDHKGRAFYDQYKQEAQTAVWSAFVNGCTRAAGIYGSVDAMSDGGPPKQEKVVLKTGHLINKKVSFFAPDYPDAVMLQAVQQGEVLNANETGQTTFAVMNKGAGSRTTAKEMSVAENDKALMGSVQLLQLSRYFNALYTFVWTVVQNYALQGTVKLLPGPDGQNDISVVGRSYIIQPAGDIDFIKREETKQLYLQMWPYVANTPIAGAYLAKMLQMFLPEDGKVFADQLNAGNPAQIVGALEAILEGLLTPETVQSMTPEQQNQIAGIMNQAKQYVTANMGAAPQNAGQAQEAQS